MNVEQIVGEFTDAWKEGRYPSVADYLARTRPEDRDEVAQLIDEWLLIAPDPDYDEAVLAKLRAHPAVVAALAAGAEQDEPVAKRVRSLREQAGFAVAALAERLSTHFAITDRARTTAYLERLEAGELDERRLSQRLLGALADVFAVDPGRLAPAPASAHAWFRAAEDADLSTIEAEMQALSAAAMTPAPGAGSGDEMDELDRLFTGGPEG